MSLISRIPINHMQQDRNAWVAYNFPDTPKDDSFYGMVEELGELAHHMLKRRQSIRGDGVDHEAEIRDACADLFIFMLGIATHEGFDLVEEIENTWMQVRERDWVKFPHDGRTR